MLNRDSAICCICVILGYCLCNMGKTVDGAVHYLGEIPAMVCVIVCAIMYMDCVYVETSVSVKLFPCLMWNRLLLLLMHVFKNVPTGTIQVYLILS